MKKKQQQNPFVYSTNPELMKAYDETHECETLAPAAQKLKVKLDTKQRAGKVVTLIDGFVGKKEDAEILGKLLKTKCGTGGAVKDNQILLQGDYKTKVIALLQQLHYKVS